MLIPVPPELVLLVVWTSVSRELKRSMPSAWVLLVVLLMMVVSVEVVTRIPAV